jgi:hypothetical protein
VVRVSLTEGSKYTEWKSIADKPFEDAADHLKHSAEIIQRTTSRPKKGMLVNDNAFSK